MHAFLICSKNKQTAIEYAKNECKKNQIDKFDINFLTFEKAIGIEDIRNFQKQVILKPIKSKIKAVILDGSKGLSTQAQNALLKILEEPPSNTIVYIAISNKDLMLSTVLSRCKIIELKDKGLELSKEENAQYLNILISLYSSGVGNRLKIAQDIAKNKDEVIPWLERMIIVARQKLIDSICHPERSPAQRGEVEESPNKEPLISQYRSILISQYRSILISLQKTYVVLKTTNVNPRLVLENLFLNL